MPAGEEKKCPKCNNVFICTPHDILNCKCSTITLQKSESEYIKDLFNDCLCIHCLLEIKCSFNT